MYIQNQNSNSRGLALSCELSCSDAVTGRDRGGRIRHLLRQCVALFQCSQYLEGILKIGAKCLGYLCLIPMAVINIDEENICIHIKSSQQFSHNRSYDQLIFATFHKPAVASQGDTTTYCAPFHLSPIDGHRFQLSPVDVPIPAQPC